MVQPLGAEHRAVRELVRGDAADEARHRAVGEQREGEGHPRLGGPQPERQRAERQVQEQVAA